MANLVAAILQQVVQWKAELSDGIMVLYERHTVHRTRPTVEELSQLLRTEIVSLDKAFILVDAMDECAEDNGVRDGFLAQLRSLTDQSNVRLMITSRPMAIIKTTFSSAGEIQIQASNGDLRRYLEAQIPQKRRLAPHVRADTELQETIIAVLIRKAAGM